MPRPIAIHLPSLIGTKEFTPTTLMIQTLAIYLQGIENEVVIAPYVILRKSGHSSSAWYKWLERPCFINWWQQASEEYHKNLGLTKVHNSIYRNALGISAQDRKLYLERFDKDYKPATATEHSFKGIEPPEQIEGAVERSRERAEGRKQVDSEVIERDSNGI